MKNLEAFAYRGFDSDESYMVEQEERKSALEVLKNTEYIPGSRACPLPWKYANGERLSVRWYRPETAEEAEALVKLYRPMPNSFSSLSNMEALAGKWICMQYVNLPDEESGAGFAFMKTMDEYTADLQKWYAEFGLELTVTKKSKY